MRMQYKGFDCEVVRGFYGNGRAALTLQCVDPPDQLRWVATVNCPECPLKDGEALVKDWSENDGILEALVEAGVAEPTGQAWKTGFVEAKVVKLLGPRP